MKVLITGASGFLGQWVMNECSKRNYEISILCRKTSKLDKLSKYKFEKHFGDLSDKPSLKSAVKGKDLIIHLAGKIAYKKSEYQSMWDINVEGTKSLISAMKEESVTDLIYLSSVVAIGASKTPSALNEKSEFNIKDLKLGYFDSKHQAEVEVLKAFKDGYIKPVIINPSTIYGPGDATKSSRSTQLKVAQGKFPFYTSGGVSIVHVSDVVKTMFLAYDKKVFGQRIIAANENISIKELFEIIAKIADQKPPRFYLPNLVLFSLGYIGEFLELIGFKGPISLENAHTASMYHWFDNSLAKEKLGIDFIPAKVAIKDSIEWAKDNGYV